MSRGFYWLFLSVSEEVYDVGKNQWVTPKVYARFIVAENVYSMVEGQF